MTERKYKFILEDTKECWDGVKSHVMYRIQNLKTGELGGYIESEDNLSHEGSCWVGEQAQVAGNVRITGDAIVTGQAQVYGNVTVQDGVRICDTAYVSAVNRGDYHPKISLYDRVLVAGHARVIDDVAMFGAVQVLDNARIEGGHGTHTWRVLLRDYAIVRDFAQVEQNSVVCNNAHLSDHARVKGSSIIAEFAKIKEQSIIIDSNVTGEALILAKSKIINCALSGELTIVSSELSNLDISGKKFISNIIRDGKQEEPDIGPLEDDDRDLL